MSDPIGVLSSRTSAPSPRPSRAGLTAEGFDETDVLVGLGIGADYMTKPFSMRELTARVRVLLRRVERAAAVAGSSQPAVAVGGVRIDRGRWRVPSGPRPSPVP